jgi:hypothetical protein
MPPMTGSNPLQLKPFTGMASDVEKALPVMRWHPRQWQTIESIGGAEILISTRPQRQWPSQGRAQSFASEGMRVLLSTIRA